MKFQPDGLAGTNVLSRHEPGRVWVGAVEFRTSIVVPWRGDPLPWGPAGFDALEPAHFDALALPGTAVVIFGSGARLRFPPPRLWKGLIARGIGVESMDTAAACRTFNVLAGEGRAVVAGLLVEGGGA